MPATVRPVAVSKDVRLQHRLAAIERNIPTSRIICQILILAAQAVAKPAFRTSNGWELARYPFPRSRIIANMLIYRLILNDSALKLPR
jgi:hypothetical protein